MEQAGRPGERLGPGATVLGRGGIGKKALRILILGPCTWAQASWGQSLYLEVQDDGPDQAKGQLGVAVSNVIIPDVHQLHLQARCPQSHPQGRAGWGMMGQAGVQGSRQPHLTVSEIVQGDLNILQLVEAHPPLFSGLQEEM